MIVAGFGFRGGASVDSLRAALVAAGADRMVGALATAEDKADTPVFRAFAAQLSLPVHAVPAEQLSAQDTATRSATSQAHRSTGSVAEAAALAAAGPGGRLVAARSISPDRMATCALAEGDLP